MSEVLILTSINGCILTDKLIDSWFDANEMFIIKKIFSDDQYSVEITFIDEERADMMSDMLSTCYGNYISITRPQILTSSSLNNSFDDERIPSPVHFSSAASVSSNISCFSQRLLALNKKTNDDKIKLAVGRGRGIDVSINKDTIHNENNLTINSNTTSPIPSMTNNNITLGYGRGRNTSFK